MTLPTPYYDRDGVTIHHGDVLDVLRQLPDGIVQTCVTSPPYWGLRTYGVEGQLGLESTPEEYITRMVEVFREVRRVLRDDGTAWVNLGDSFAHNGACGGASPLENPTDGRVGNHSPRGRVDDAKAQQIMKYRVPPGLKPKDLCGMPWRVALALQQPYEEPCCVKKNIDRAWLAALFDGEGCIGVRRFTSYRKEKRQEYQDGFVVYTVVTNNDRELLDRCVQITGLGSVRMKQRASDTDGRGIVSRRNSYGWRLDGNSAVSVIKAIYPYLVAKKKQAILAYTLDRSNKDVRSERGNSPVPKSEQEKRELIKRLVNDCNQRRPVDLPSWCVEPLLTTESGWYLRSDIIWAKPNPMPESCTDRPTKAHEYIFLLSKSARYYYDADAVREESVYGPRSCPPGAGNATRKDEVNDQRIRPTHIIEVGTHRNKRTVWTVATESFSGAHFATYPRKLIEPCIMAGATDKACAECGKPWKRVVERDTPPGDVFTSTAAVGDGFVNRGFDKAGKAKKGSGQKYQNWLNAHPPHTKGFVPDCTCGTTETRPSIVLDPFMGSGTTAEVARKHGCHAIGIELNAEYIDLAAKRLAQGVLEF